MRPNIPLKLLSIFIPAYTSPVGLVLSITLYQLSQYYSDSHSLVLIVTDIMKYCSRCE